MDTDAEQHLTHFGRSLAEIAARRGLTLDEAIGRIVALAAHTSEDGMLETIKEDLRRLVYTPAAFKQRG